MMLQARGPACSCFRRTAGWGCSGRRIFFFFGRHHRARDGSDWPRYRLSPSRRPHLFRMIGQWPTVGPTRPKCTSLIGGNQSRGLFSSFVGRLMATARCLHVPALELLALLAVLWFRVWAPSWTTRRMPSLTSPLTAFFFFSGALVFIGYLRLRSCRLSVHNRCCTLHSALCDPSADTLKVDGMGMTLEAARGRGRDFSPNLSHVSQNPPTRPAQLPRDLSRSCRAGRWIRQFKNR